MLFILGAAAVYGLYLLLSKIKLGKMMRATSQNQVGAQLVGVNTRRVYDYTLMFAAALAALAGILMAPIISAHPFMGQPLLIMGFAVVIVAGMGNLLGALIVGIVLGVVEALFGQYVSTYYRTPFIYAIMILILLSRPQGLFGRR
jgi:branched-chain amino acid transport system permease protein